MAKKGFFSWFRKDKAQEEQVDETESLATEELESGESAAEQSAQETVATQAMDNHAEEDEVVEYISNEADVELDPEEFSELETDVAEEQNSIIEPEPADDVVLEEDLLSDEQVLQPQVAEEQVAEICDAQELDSEQEESEEAKSQELVVEAEEAEQQPEPQAKPAKEGFFARLKRGLMRTSENIGSGFIGLFKGKKIDDELFEELEEQLLIADVGVETTTKLINSLTDHASRKQLKDAEALYELLREEMQNTLEPASIPLVPENSDGPFVILMVGVNGVGKTTTIGKLAKQYQSQGKSVMLAAGDTFRAAAVEQLQVWGQRNDIPVVAQHTGADSASVLFDALQAAKARNVDVLIADTAGRLQNKGHLMEELKKVVRVMQKLDVSAPHEVMLTLDASTGQNAISQAQLFQEAVGVTGITISKLDGTAKGGVIFAIADKFGIPIRHIGVGEQIDDLRTFNAKDFIDALFSQEKSDS